MKRIIMVWVILIITMAMPVWAQSLAEVTATGPIDNLYQALGGPTKTTDFFIVEYEGYDWDPCSGDT